MIRMRIRFLSAIQKFLPTFTLLFSVVSAMIRRVEVSLDYKLTIYFNFNLDQFLHGLDCGGTIQAGGV